MYSVIGLLSRPEELSVTEWRAWWTELHVPKVLALPGLIDYVIWPIDEELDQFEQTFSEPSYAGVAIITFESKKEFLEAIESRDGHADLDSFNSSAPRSLVLCGQPFV
ncbi:EthD family reductase [Nocardioides immobilis]|uniref:EthD family reductase n=1 Tax=Nocardioides immobilis TaxID=2049295 RepID=A0A417Y0P8_9ACTN|nr:EthD family reductase [Nocardioides immobilis]RHW26219.1 EthD family reductase [Nocardioides immobilis]